MISVEIVRLCAYAFCNKKPGLMRVKNCGRSGQVMWSGRVMLTVLVDGTGLYTALAKHHGGSPVMFHSEIVIFHISIVIFHISGGVG